MPQVEHLGGTLEDKVNWTLVSLSYTAAGGENFVTIGNFRSDPETTVTSWPCCGQYGAYYHLDDVSLVEVPSQPALDLDCGLGDDECSVDAAADTDGVPDFDEIVHVAFVAVSGGPGDITNFTATLVVAGATVLSPAGGLIELPIVQVGNPLLVEATLLMPAEAAATCGDVVDLTLIDLVADQGAWPDDPLPCGDFRIGQGGTCGNCVAASTCLWRADATTLSPLDPPSTALFFEPPTLAGISIQGLSYHCPMASGDLEPDAQAAVNGVPLSFYQVDVASDTLRVARVGDTLRFTF